MNALQKAKDLVALLESQPQRPPIELGGMTRAEKIAALIREEFEDQVKKSPYGYCALEIRVGQFADAIHLAEPQWLVHFGGDPACNYSKDLSEVVEADLERAKKCKDENISIHGKEPTQ